MWKNLLKWCKDQEQEWVRTSPNRFGMAPFFAFIAAVWLAFEISDGSFDAEVILAGAITGIVWGFALVIYWRTGNAWVGGFLFFCILTGLRKAPKWILGHTLESASWSQNNQYMASSVLIAMILVYFLRNARKSTSSRTNKSEETQASSRSE